MINTLVYLIVLLIVMGLIIWAVSLIPGIDPVILRIIQIVVILLFILLILHLFGLFDGPMPGRRGAVWVPTVWLEERYGG